MTAVMGDYHQIDVISQSYVYADRDTLDGAISGNMRDDDHDRRTEHSKLGAEKPGHACPRKRDSRHESSTFPTSWRVNVVEGDLSIVPFGVEQYNFASDNAA